jgi:hypothetical protein
MTELPIPVRRLKPEQALLIACEVCGAEAHIDPDGLRNDGDFSCPASCGATLSATFKYAEGNECPNCKRLGWDTTDVDGCCSRRCALQAEYARRLEKA